jgi:hypothetical protein
MSALNLRYANGVWQAGIKAEYLMRTGSLQSGATTTPTGSGTRI